MNAYFFVLGRTFTLCEAELFSVLSHQGIAATPFFNQDPVIGLSIDFEIDVSQLLASLGGTIKIAHVVGTLKQLSATALVEFVSTAGKNFTFGFSFYSSSPIPIAQLHQEEKQILKEKGISSRFVLPKNHQELSAVVVQKQHVEEYILVFDNQKKEWLVAQTLVVQDVDLWSKRDFGRPFADPKSGMLPPKVARMMVNLASSKFRPKDDQPLADTVHSSQLKPILLDPFCGMGTILQEALMVGWQVVGSDVSTAVIDKAQKNIEWLGKTDRVQFFVSDATHISQKIALNSLDAIVTEPFMGLPFEKRGEQLFQKNKRVTQKEIANTIKGLEKLYIGALKNWWPLLKVDGCVVVALPNIQFSGKDFSVKKVVDMCESFGYTLSQGPYPYSRPQAVVKRQIYVFTKAQNSKPQLKT